MSKVVAHPKWQLYSCINSAEISYNGRFSDTNNSSLIAAIEFHQRHLEMGDEAGQFVAHTNLGLTLGSLNRVSRISLV